MSENNLHSTGHMPPHATMRPKIAIIDNNVLATIGLKNLLQNVIENLLIPLYHMVNIDEVMKKGDKC